MLLTTSQGNLREIINNYGNGLTETRSYDQDYRLTSLTVPNTLSWTLGYNADDDITGLTDNLVGSNSQTLGYDNLNRLDTGGGAYGSLSYGYDANGNRNTETLNGTNTTFTIASSSNQLVSLSGGININYSYDADGNLIGDGTHTYTYDNTNRLASVVTSSGTDTYQYNALGQRVEKTVGSTTTVYVYDEAGHLLGEYSPSGTLIAEHIWLNNRPIGVITPTGLYYVHTDQLNTPRYITNSSKQLVWEWQSDPFGTSAPNQNPSGLGTFVYNFRFPGQYYDAETGKNYNYFWDYDPTVGRYIESDPIGLGGGINTYAYAFNQPTNWIDLLGLYATVTINGNTITVNVPISINGKYATSALASAWQSSINSYWNAKTWKYENCTVTFNATVVANGNAANSIQVGPPGINGRSFVNRVGGDTGTWYADAGDWTAAHETGHLMGESDHYQDVTQNGVTISVPNPGWGQNIMAIYGGTVDGGFNSEVQLQLTG